jgi:hypothetical protein
LNPLEEDRFAVFNRAGRAQSKKKKILCALSLSGRSFSEAWRLGGENEYQIVSL